MFWTTLANDDDFSSLTEIVIIGEKNWFGEESEQCLAPFLVVLARQPALTRIVMGGLDGEDNSLS